LLIPFGFAILFGFRVFLPILHVFLNLLRIDVHLRQKVVDHVLHAGTKFETATTASAAAATSSASVSSTHVAPISSSALHGIKELVKDILTSRGPVFLLFFGLGSIFAKNGDHGFGGSTIFTNLNKGVLMTESLLTQRAVVEVFAHGTLEADSFDWISAAAVALHVGVLN